MAEVKVEHMVARSRQEAACWISDQADALNADGPVTLRLARSTVELEIRATDRGDILVIASPPAPREAQDVASSR
jgi:uncharacterized protein YbjQ (UPF0145 family)